MVADVFHPPDEFGDEEVVGHQHVGLRSHMVVQLVRFASTNGFDELREGHVVAQPHAFHGAGHIINLQDFVVVCRDKSVEGIAHEAEAEMRRSQLPRLLRRDQLCFAMGVAFPEPIGCGFDITLRLLAQQFAEAGFD